MRRVANQLVKALADVTVGSVIVLFHLALAERESKRWRLDSRRGDRAANDHERSIY
jgi:hypothetical protein